MRQETNMVFEKIIEFKLSIKAVLDKGLIKLAEKDRDKRKEMLKELFFKLGPENTAKPETAGNNSERSGNSGKNDSKDKEKSAVVLDQYQIPMFATFEWLAEEVNWTKKKFDPQLIDDTFSKTEKLKDTFDYVSNLTIQINKRETLLGV